MSLLNDQLGDPIDKFFARLTPDRSFWRLGWGVLDSADLYQPLDGTAAPRPTAHHGSTTCASAVERETLRRFPRTGCVLFTIRTYLAHGCASLPPIRPTDRRLAEALAAMPDERRGYKQIDRVDRDPVSGRAVRSRAAET